MGSLDRAPAWALAGVVGSLVIAGCSPVPVWDECRVQCGDGNSCPSGLTCLDDGYCHHSMADTFCACVDTCHADAECMLGPGFGDCVCGAGYRGDGVTACDDIDECAEDPETCDANADCENTIGSRTCTCHDGFTGDGESCTNIDECMDGTAACHADAVCTDQAPFFECACLPGFVGDGFTCLAGGTLTVAGGHSCRVGADGTLRCWGADGDGQQGNGALVGTVLMPTQIGTETTWRYVTAGFAHTCATRADGTLWCWGNDLGGQLGNGDGTLDVTAPAREATLAATWSQVSAGGIDAGRSHTCAVRTDGTLWCWGDDSAEQQGNGPALSNDVHTPTQVGIATDWAFVAAGGDFTCALRTGGSLWCWGGGSTDSAGGGSEVPVRVGTDSDWLYVGAGEGQACGLRAGGSLWCWGRGAEGQLGDGQGANSATPVQVMSGSSWRLVGELGASHSCASQSDGSLWCWGRNTGDQLGTNGNDSDTPVRVGTATSWAISALGEDMSCAEQTDGHVWCWGTGTIGDGSSNANMPVQVD